LISIASQLRRSIAGFADALHKSAIDETHLCGDEWSLQEIFENVIAKPASSVERNEDDRVIVVMDALDECEESAELCLLLQHQWANDVPKWLGLLVTSRPNHREGWPSGVSRSRANASENSDKDLAMFVRAKLMRNEIAAR
jgi:hypothetical protein